MRKISSSVSPEVPLRVRLLRRVGLRPIGLLVGVMAAAVPGLSIGEADDQQPWALLQPANDRGPTARHESALAAVGSTMWLFGGRGERPVEVFYSGVNSWRSSTPMPAQLHHFQPAVIGADIYVIGAFIGGYPDETPVAEIYKFDTRSERWSVVGTVPEARRRGSAATAVKDGWIYLVGGNTLGHNGGAVPWLDRWRPSDDSWETLSDAPNARDHFSAAFVDGQLVAAAGRASALPNVFANTVAATDVYDPAADDWDSAASIPTVRAGALAIGYDGELIVAGGEDTGPQSRDEVEAFSVRLNRWRTLQPLISGRHSGGGALLDDRFHVIAGSTTRGGGGEVDTHEYLELVPAGEADSDGDGLSDDDERDVHGTDPMLSDTDGDTLEDGAEVDLGTDPTLADSDADGLDDADELAAGTDPRRADSDDDGLDDGSEALQGTDPLQSDSDLDGLPDGAEVTEHGTDPLVIDTDADGISDGQEVLDGTDPLVPQTGGTDDGGDDGTTGSDGDDGTIDPEPSSGGGGGGAGAPLLLLAAMLARRYRLGVNKLN